MLGPEFILMLLILFFIIFFVAGMEMPFVHILCGITGLFLAVFVFDQTGYIPLSILISAFAVFILLMGITRKSD